jgi:Poly(ADP-ribose) polymerase catalytic domain
MNWKPLMSEAEAEEYTRDSYYQGQDFYHGTSAENADGIVTEGAKWSLDSENSYGDGFYMTQKESRAAEYAKANKNPSIVTARILCKNPKIFQNGTDFYEFLDNYEIPVGDSEAGFASRLLINQGYDSVEIRGTQTLVIILNPQQVAAFKNESGT